MSRFAQGEFFTDVFFLVFRSAGTFFALPQSLLFSRCPLRIYLSASSFLTCDTVRVCAVLSFSCGDPVIFLSRRSPLVCFVVLCLCLSLSDSDCFCLFVSVYQITSQAPVRQRQFWTIQIDNRNREAKWHPIFFFKF